MKFLISVSIYCLAQITLAQAQVGIFESQVDVGNPKLMGSTSYSDSDQSYSIKGAGYNIWFERDEFHYAYNKIKGDFILTANFEFMDVGADPHRKIGWMVRESLDKSAAHVSAVAHGDGLTVMQWRVLRGAFMRDPEDEIFYSKKNVQMIQLERAGRKFTMRVARLGEPLETVGSHEMEWLKDEVLVGLFICSHKEDVVEHARIWNVKIEKP